MATGNTSDTPTGGWSLQPHPCPRCGKKTIFRVCDVCAGATHIVDEFASTLAAVRAAPEVKPDVRWWSGVCMWCAKEIREQSGEEHTHMPPLSRIRTCYRHRKALLGLSAWLRNEKFGQKGGAA